QLLFGSLPLIYYIFDYITTVYSNALYSGIYALNEFIPTILVVFYVLFLTAYHGQQEKRAEAELRHSMLEAELKQSETEVENLRRSEKQTAIYQHDMRHHLRMIENYLSTGKIQQAEDYIKDVYSDIEAITPKRYCENETVNLLVSAFVQRAEKAGIRLSVDAKIPKEQPLPDTELCALISNGLDNALRAAAEADKQVDFYCGIRHNKLLIEVKNAYKGELIMKNGLPYTKKSGHGHGTKSIRTITESHRGICTFDAQNGIFTLRIVLPV
ncbi:MAG: GHKL domain-containing protein, partial [Firmicutes bacterium]|nr:GHKL domain-containing protein [Bacillota bacterium]